jgi:hypothetical protein
MLPPIPSNYGFAQNKISHNFPFILEGKQKKKPEKICHKSQHH